MISILVRFILNNTNGDRSEFLKEGVVMSKELVALLHMQLEPVGIFFGNTTAEVELAADPQKRNCVIPFVMAAAKGKITSMDEAGCTCPGGAVGACFGDGFTRLNPNIHMMLSQGVGDKVPEGVPEHAKRMLQEGERFFCSPGVALKWRNSMPFSEKGYPRIVFAPMSKWESIGTPGLVYIFANPDQISALVTMLGSHNGEALNTLAPYGAACHSIVFAAEQMEKERPMAIMGLFDISQRSKALSGMLSLTMPYSLWVGLSENLEKSCLTSHSWKMIEERMQLAQ